MVAMVIALAVLGADEWKQVHLADGVTVDERPVEGSSFAELRATASVRLPVEALCAGAFGTSALDKKEPNLKSRKVLSESENERVSYDQISAPVVSDRDYVVRTRRERDGEKCTVFVDAVKEGAPPVPEGTVRVEKLRCRWEFEKRGAHTKVTYFAWTDPNTSMPAFMVEPSRRKLMVTWMKLVMERAATAK